MHKMVSTQELLEYVGLDHEDLETKCEDEDLRELSLSISNWEKYAPFLQLAEADIEDIETKNTTGSKMLLALQRWKQMFAFRATYGFLVNDVFMKTRDAANAEHVCQLLKSTLRKRKTESSKTSSVGDGNSTSNSNTAEPQVHSPSFAEGIRRLPEGFTKEFSKKNVDIAVKMVTHWEDLGEKLNLPTYKLKEITMDLAHKGTSRQKSEMIDLWLRYDVTASWSKLCAALEQIDEHRLAQEIQFVVGRN